MAKYEVLSETGIILEGEDETVHATGEVLDLDPENDQVKALHEVGSIGPVVEDAPEAAEAPAEETAEEAEVVAPAEEAEDDAPVEGVTAPGERHPLA